MMLDRDFFGVLEFRHLFCLFFFLMRQLWQGSERLLQYGAGVAITSGEKHENSWNGMKSVITLHQEKQMIQFFDFMIRLNIMV